MERFGEAPAWRMIMMLCSIKMTTRILQRAAANRGSRIDGEVQGGGQQQRHTYSKECCWKRAKMLRGQLRGRSSLARNFATYPRGRGIFCRAMLSLLR